MRHVIRFLLFVVALGLVQSCVVADSDQWSQCGRDARLEVVDLDISPDPIADGQQIRELRVRLRADDRTRCQTMIQVSESPGNDIVGRERLSRLRAGNNDIELEAVGGYRFSRNEHCFAVIANIEGNYRPIDAARRFCARQISGRRWTLKE